MNGSPDFRSPEFLRGHIAETMAFYHPRAIDPQGGFFHYFKDDGTVYDASHRHLVSSTRFVFNYAMAYRRVRRARVSRRRAPRPALSARRASRSESGGYAWTIRDGRAEDRTNHCYGVAFVLLAYATARRRACSEAAPGWTRPGICWNSASGMPRRACTATKPRPTGCSATTAARTPTCICARPCSRPMRPPATPRYLDRAYVLADHMTRRQAAKAGGLVWEHYDRDWRPTGITTGTIRSTCSAPGVSSPGTRWNGPSCC